MSAVSNAGGLGIITARASIPLLPYSYSSSSYVFHFVPVTQPSPEDLRKAIRETRSLIKGNKPFGVNITILPSIVPPDYEGYARAAIEEG